MLYVFDKYQLDVQRRELRREGDLVAIEPRVFDLLLYLIRNRERVVSRDALITAVWNGRIVSDSAVSGRMNAARSAIGDSGDQQRVIRTIARKGFRFVGEVREVAPSSASATAEPEVPQMLTDGEAARRSPEKPSIAVLPFINMSDDTKQGYFADGISDDIITELSRLSELLVTARNSSFQYRGRSVDVRRVGRELGVHYVLEGSVRRVGDRVRISAQLIDAETGSHRWGDRYDRQLDDVFAIQDEISRTITSIVSTHVNKAETERTLLKSRTLWRPHDYYLRAAAAYASFRSSRSVEQLYEVRRLLEQSISLDVDYSRSYSLMSATYQMTYANRLNADYYSQPIIERAYELARKAMQLDPSLPEVHAQWGMVLIWTGQHERAILELERAIAINPNFTDARFVSLLVLAGEPLRAIQFAEAHMRRDPFYPPTLASEMGFAHYILKRYPEALQFLHECVSRAPNFRPAYVFLAATYAQLGRLDEARAAAREVLRIDPDYKIAGRQTRVRIRRRPEDSAHLADGLRKAGLPER